RLPGRARLEAPAAGWPCGHVEAAQMQHRAAEARHRPRVGGARCHEKNFCQHCACCGGPLRCLSCERRIMSTTPDFDPVPQLAEELSLPAARVAAVVSLLVEGNTVPFIARYRKEVTGGMDEVQIRTIEERRAYLLELEERRRTILASIDEQGKLTDELRDKILACTTKA